MSKDQRYMLFALLISWLLGYIGADRFYRGEVGLGVLKLVTFGGLGIWYLVDALILTYRFGKLMK
jgi:TM2 domain-containing membrane protein YozV